ncbi:MAG: hypothetical protein Q7J44_17675 [Pseudotabrizicola sp.]|uniref:hypothetical protein n=1 Tax=Pseudotabrizicola sp. TaxID=2939647 RepID=UPI00271684C6|nr:hypothetical protein [Pseudotabrizicola sp.]MDO9640367.1 hypothetical protein [Pseudotabrizicola sp.]
MTEKNARTGTGTTPLRGAELREARLKAALKANMARRKAQAKQRGAGALAADADTGTVPDTGAEPAARAGPDALPEAEDPTRSGTRGR